MIAIVDACSILNILQVFFEEKYIEDLKLEFKEVFITHKVFEEIINNKHKNFQNDPDSQNRLDNVIRDSYLETLIYEENYEDCHKILEKTIKSKHTWDKNGEYYSASLALYLSREGKEKFYENLLNIVFVTDDAPAEQDFKEFFQINQIGTIINSIDLMTIFYLKKRITKNELISYCTGLKDLYAIELSFIKNEVESLKKSEKKIKIQMALSQILIFLEDGKYNELKELDGKKDFKKILHSNKRLKHLINNIDTNKLRRKIRYIDERIWQIKNEYIWRV
jgi:hypothetical protein